VQASTGFALAGMIGYPMTRGWIAYGIALYVIAGTCWIAVVALQIRMREPARRGELAGCPARGALLTLCEDLVLARCAGVHCCRSCD